MLASINKMFMKKDGIKKEKQARWAGPSNRCGRGYTIMI
jgi:hypothetical protein